VRYRLRLTLAGFGAGLACGAALLVWLVRADAEIDRGLRMDGGDWTLRDVNRRSSLW